MEEWTCTRSANITATYTKWWFVTERQELYAAFKRGLRHDGDTGSSDFSAVVVELQYTGSVVLVVRVHYCLLGNVQLNYDDVKSIACTANWSIRLDGDG